MTEAEAIKKMIQICVDEIKASGFLIFFKRDIRFVQTRLLEPWEKTANLKLPEKIIDSNEHIVINSNGISGLTHHLKWSDVVATGIKTEVVRRNRDTPLYFRSLLVAVKDSDQIIELKIGNIDKFHGLFGHFIEEYKLAYKKNNP